MARYAESTWNIHEQRRYANIWRTNLYKISSMHVKETLPDNYEIWNSEYGILNKENGLRNMVYGILNTEYGLRITEYGIQNMEYGI